MANSTKADAAAAKAKAALAKALRQKNNENTPKFFAAGIVGLIFLFMVFHWARFVFKHYGSKNGSSGLLKVPVRISR
jgi:hypothetical protein